MADIEKVVSGIEKILAETDEYDGVLWDALELLTVQQSKIKELESELEYVTSHGPQIFGGY